MREIKFRAKHTSNEDWGYSMGPGLDIFFEFIIRKTLNPDTLGQYTGLKDKNGEEIYEGDIVRNEREEVGQIVFASGAFVSKYIPPYDWDAMEKYDGLLNRQEVIGNIYENPELLKEQVKKEQEK